jgi:hypothetical protein
MTAGNLPLQKTLLLRHCESYDKHHLPHYVKEWEERAAIMEFDGGMTREAAELEAARICRLEPFLEEIRH